MNGLGTARQSGQGRELVQRFHQPPKILATFLSLSLFIFLLPDVDERTSSRIGLYQGEKSKNLGCVVRISKRGLKGLIRKQEGKNRHGAHDGEDAAYASICSSGHPEGTWKESAFGRRSHQDRMYRVVEQTLVGQRQENGEGIDHGSPKPV